MTAIEIKLVQESFPAIARQAGPISMLFYGRLFQMDPLLRPMFRQDIELQGRKLMDMLSALAMNLNRYEELVPGFKALGQRHVAYGVRAEHYELVAKALIWAFGTALESDFHPELRAAWSSVVAAVATTMKGGAAELLPSV